MPAASFSVAFLNAYHLYPFAVRTVGNKKDVLSDADKVSGLAAGLIRAAGPAGPPDLIGLCEVGDASMGRDVLAAVDPSRYSAIWQRPPGGGWGHPGLMVGYNAGVFAVEEVVPPEVTVGEAGRYHWIAVRLRLRQAGPEVTPFWAVVVHWPSGYGSGQLRGTWPRVQVGRALGEFWANRARDTTDAMVIIGDFNCEPFDVPVTGEALGGVPRLVAAREHDRVLRATTTLPYFYDPMWRVLGEGQGVEHRVVGGVRPRPPGTFAPVDQRASAAAEWRCLDHLLVNRWMLTGVPASLLEDTLAVAETTPGASDHCAIAARFAYATSLPG